MCANLGEDITIMLAITIKQQQVLAQDKSGIEV